MLGGHHPWYVFRGHPIPATSDEDREHSFVPLDIVPTPPHMQQAFELVLDDHSDLKGR